jgi:hypothetical protein
MRDHGTGAEAGGPAGDGNLKGALADQEDFFVCMVMCRMRTPAAFPMADPRAVRAGELGRSVAGLPL